MKPLKYLLPTAVAVVLASAGARATDAGSAVLLSDAAAPDTVVLYTDSLAATFGAMFGMSIDGVLTDLQHRGITIDRSVLAGYVSRYLRGENYPMTPDQVEQYYNTFRQSMSPGTQATLSPESQQKALDEAAARPGAQVLESGVVIETIQRGDGIIPGMDNSVSMRYVGTLSDGTVFDQITESEAPETFTVGELTPGFAEALTHLPLGGRYRITIPASGAYGEDGIPGAIPPGATLIFTVELLK